MSPQRPAAPGPSAPDPAARLEEVAEAVTGLACELDALRRSVDPLAALSTRVEDLGGVVRDLANKLAALSARKAPTPCPSWLLAPTRPAPLVELLDGLRVWLEAVYLRYTDAATSLPECWSLHPDVVEELLWLMHAWLAAYQGPAAAVGLVADWHDRYRPGVVRRLAKAVGSCSLERHQTRPGWAPPPGPPTVPGGDTVTVIAGWWSAHRDRPAPEPGPRDQPADAPYGDPARGRDLPAPQPGRWSR